MNVPREKKSSMPPLLIAVKARNTEQIEISPTEITAIVSLYLSLDKIIPIEPTINTRIFNNNRTSVNSVFSNAIAQ